MPITYKVNPEYRDADCELKYCKGAMMFEDRVYPLRFKESDMAKATELITRNDFSALQELAIKPLIAERT